MQNPILDNSQKAWVKPLMAAGFLILALTLSGTFSPRSSLAAEPTEQTPGSTVDNVKRPATKLPESSPEHTPPSSRAIATSPESLPLQTEHTLPAAEVNLSQESQSPKPAAKEEGEEIMKDNKNPADSWQVHLRSTVDTTSIPRRPQLNYVEDTPVHVPIVSTDIHQRPSWYRPDVNAPKEKPGVKVNLSSPLSIPSSSRPSTVIGNKP